MSLAAFSYGTTVYASPWGITDFVLSLITHKYLLNQPLPSALFGNEYKTVHSFDVNVVSSLSEIYVPDIPNISVSQDASIVSFNHFPHEQNEKLRVDCNLSHPQQCSPTQNFYHRFDEEYMEYTLWDLLSGLGGIVTGSFSLCAMIIKVTLFGVWKWKGLAPYPPLSKAFQEQLRRFNRMEGRMPILSA